MTVADVVLFIIFLIMMSAIFSILEIIKSSVDGDGIDPNNVWNIFFAIALVITFIYLVKNNPECASELIYLYMAFIFFVLLVSLFFGIPNMGTLEGSTKATKMIEHGFCGNFWSLL